MINKLFKSIIDQDEAPIVVCDDSSTVVYMNPSSVAHYKVNLVGKSIKACHPPKANEKIDEVLRWFRASKNNNKVYTFRNDTVNKDVYMVALRDDDGTLIGYYEKHCFREKEKSQLYEMN